MASMNNKIRLSEHFTYGKLLRFTLPSIVMVVFSSIYGVIDGIFVSNYVGKTAFAAINLIMPFLMILGAVGFMIGNGGSAFIAKKLGEGSLQRANRSFSTLVYSLVTFGVFLSVIGCIFLKDIAMWFGTSGEMLDDCVKYGRILMLSLPAFMLQNAFQEFCTAAGKPKLGLGIIVTAGVTNIVLDFVFIAVFGWGLAGAAIATVISQLIGGTIPVAYFIRDNESSLRLMKVKADWAALLGSATNGASEFVGNISMSVVAILYNFQLMRIAGEDGVAAYGVIMYAYYIFLSIFIGYDIGCAPIIAYHHGAANHGELRNLMRKSLVIIGCMGIGITIVAESLSYPLSWIFVGHDPALLELTHHGLMIYSLSFLLAGFNLFGSAFFTALNNGIVSASISFLRTILFEMGTVAILPLFFGINGIWSAIVFAELLSLLVTIYFFSSQRMKYGY